VPSWPYERLERWHYLSFLKSPKTLEMLERIQRTASTPERLEAFVLLIKLELGYQLHEAVQRTKFELSSHTESEFAFQSGPVSIRKRITRADFERWIKEELDAMSGCVDRLMDASGLSFGDIDRVFLTGGSSFVPAVKQIFVDRFGGEKVTGGEELTSVATGLRCGPANSGRPTNAPDDNRGDRRRSRRRNVATKTRRHEARIYGNPVRAIRPKAIE